MEWEPSESGDDFSMTFEELEDVDIRNASDQKYIVPDTNVFLSAISCISDVIANGM